MNFITTALANHKVGHTLENIYLINIKRISFKVKNVTGHTLEKDSNPTYLAENNTYPFEIGWFHVPYTFIIE
jgi:hypothetical protein